MSRVRAAEPARRPANIAPHVIPLPPTDVSPTHTSNFTILFDTAKLHYSKHCKKCFAIWTSRRFIQKVRVKTISSHRLLSHLTHRCSNPRSRTFRLISGIESGTGYVLRHLPSTGICYLICCRRWHYKRRVRNGGTTEVSIVGPGLAIAAAAQVQALGGRQGEIARRSCADWGGRIWLKRRFPEAH
jgi:hypothetical protein